MLRRSTSFETNPMPMKIAMKAEHADGRQPDPGGSGRPALLSCPRRNDEAISITPKSTRLYGTRSRTDSRNTLSATQLAARN
jgi:hypothetical protein